MSKTLTSLLVGMHFRPPAKTILAHLPSGCKLGLQPEPENQYDENALQVLIDPADIPESQHGVLAEELPLQGSDLQQVLSAGPIHLGYVAKSHGQPLIKAMNASGGQLELVGNAEFLENMVKSDPSMNDAKLGFGPGGEPLVHLRVDEEEPELDELSDPEMVDEEEEDED